MEYTTNLYITTLAKAKLVLNMNLVHIMAWVIVAFLSLGQKGLSSEMLFTN